MIQLLKWLSLLMIKMDSPADIDEKGRHMCAIIKDAHNLDSFRLFVNYPYVDTVIKKLS